jgi:competence protein ComEA
MLKKFVAALAFMFAAASWAAVDVNKATAADLDGVKGIGPATSAKILEERKKGEFKDWADFIGRVPGIGEGNATKLSGAGLRVGGKTYSAKKDDKKEDKKEVKKDEKKDSKAAPVAAAAAPKAAASTAKK